MEKHAIIFGTGSLAEVVDFYLTHDSPYRVVAFTATGDSIKESNYAYFAARNLSSDTLIEVPGSHYFVLEQPETAERIIVDFFPRTPQASQESYLNS